MDDGSWCSFRKRFSCIQDGVFFFFFFFLRDRFLCCDGLGLRAARGAWG